MNILRLKSKKYLFLLTLLLLFLLPAVSYGADPLLQAFKVTNTPSGSTYSVSLQILFIMTLLSMLPAMVIMMTSFTRIIIVFAILRQALGMPQTPTNQILIGIALFLTLFIMGPVFNKINEVAIQPYLNDSMGAKEALIEASQPLKEFMLQQIRSDDLALFSRLSGEKSVPDIKQLSMKVIVPAFITSELKTAFQIGFLIFIPFLVIDLVVASVLMAMGMMMLSPLIISLPFKIMLFVLVDGWTLIVGTLASSFGL